MLKYTVLTILVNIFLGFQQQNYRLEKTFDYKANSIQVDQLNNLYVINGPELKKIDLENNQETNYSNSLLGNIYSIDVSDPFRTVIFYKDFNKIEFLDKNLSQIRSPVSLDDLGYYNVSAVCQSVNGGFWIFDHTLKQLAYIDKNLKNTENSSELSELIDLNTDQKQVFMLEKNDYIYLGIRGVGVLLFDSYGTYIKTFPLANIGVFQVNNEIISYYYNGEMYFYNMENYTEKSVRLPGQNNKQALILNRKLIILTGNELYIYQFRSL